MKKILFTAPLLLLALLFSGCSKDDNGAEPFVSPFIEIGINNPAYVICQGTNKGTFSVVDWENNNVLNKTDSIGHLPQNGVTCKNRVFVACYGNNCVSVFDYSLDLLKKIPLIAPQSVCTDGQHVYAVANDSVFLIDANNLQKVKGEPAGHTAYGCVYSDGYVYINIGRTWEQNENGNTVAKFDAQTLEKVKEFVIGNNPYNQIAADKDGNVFTVCTTYPEQGEIYRIDSNDGVNLWARGSYIAVKGDTLLIVDAPQGMATGYYAYSTKTHLMPIDMPELQNTSNLPMYPMFIAVNPANGHIYMGEYNYYDTNANGGSLYHLDGNAKLIKKLSVGAGPYAIVFP